jgi:hypothetical protein
MLFLLILSHFSRSYSHIFAHSCAYVFVRERKKMHSRSVFILCTIAIFLFMVSSSVTVAEEQHYPGARKLAGGQWLAAPHFQALSKRGRFVFRDAQKDSNNDDVDDSDDHPAKRNWRL